MDIATIIGVVSTLLVSIASYYFSDLATKTFNTRAKEAKVALQDAKEKVKEQPNQLRPVWEYAQAKIDEYVANNLVELGLIFRISIIVMSVGFIMIVGGIGLFVYLLFNPLQPQINQGVTTASVSAMTMPGLIASSWCKTLVALGSSLPFMSFAPRTNSDNFCLDQKE